MTLAQQYHLEARQEGAVNSRRQEVLEVRFGEIPAGLREEVNATSDEKKLQMLHRAAIQCASVEAFAAAL